MDSERLVRVRATMKASGFDALFVSSPKNVRYTTGVPPMGLDMVQPFNDPEYFALITPERCSILCDGRYFAGVKSTPGISANLLESPVTSSVIAKKIADLLDARARRIGFEQDALLYRDATELLAALPHLDWSPADGLFSSLRVIKTPAERDLLRKAQAITCDCFEHIAAFIRVGMTEKQVALEIDDYFRRNAEGNSFYPIVAFGETGAFAHYTPSDARRLSRGQFVLLDFGAVYGGYCGDLTRMLCMGPADARQKEVYDLVLTAQMRCVAGVRPGVTTGSLDSICRDYFESRGCADKFIHGTGHGVGLAIHEDPRLKKQYETRVEPGMVFTVEPGLYFEGWGGVRIEDMVIVTDQGCENITPASKTLREVPC